MVKIQVPYTIHKTKEFILTTREYCEYHANLNKLKEILAKENGVEVDDISIDKLEIIEGQLDFKKSK